MRGFGSGRELTAPADLARGRHPQQTRGPGPANQLSSAFAELEKRDCPHPLSCRHHVRLWPWRLHSAALSITNLIGILVFALRERRNVNCESCQRGTGGCDNDAEKGSESDGNGVD